MRKALIGLLVATTAASPLAAQDNGWRGRGDGERHQRADGEERGQRHERQQAPQQAQPQQRQGGWQARQQAQVQAQPQVQVQQQVQTRGYRQGYQGQQAYGGGGNYQQQQQQDAYRQQIEASRAANRAVSQNMPESYRRKAAENEANYERQLARRRYGRDSQRSGYSGYEARQTYQGQQQRYDGRRYDGQQRYDSRQGYDRRQSSRDHVQWNRTWRNDNRYDWQRYRYSNRSLFRSPYYAPYGYGYGYNRLSIGGLLDQIFWGRDYWIADPYEYRLPAAPYGTQWVRYYNDVVLVDVYSGEVIDVIYDFFW